MDVFLDRSLARYGLMMREWPYTDSSRYALDLAMRLWQMRNDAENAHICAYMR